MDNRLNYINEHIDEMKIGPNDTFHFRCTMCGKCCRYRNDIILNPFDVYRLAKHFHIKPHEFIKHFCITYLGQDSNIPLVSLISVGVDERCPFLLGNRCSVNSCKPSVCALYPLGRYLSRNMETGQFTEVKYILQPIKCGDKRRTHVVRDWLIQSGLELQDKIFTRWMTVSISVSETIVQILKHIDPKKLEPVWDFLYIFLYLHYDIEQEFLPQLEKNLDTVTAFIQKLRNDFEEFIKKE